MTDGGAVDPFTALADRGGSATSGPVESWAGTVVDGYYRYPDPDTGKPRRWSRVSSYAKVISDTYALEQWEKRMILFGLTVREDLYVKACGTQAHDRETLDAIAREAKTAGGGEAGANIGTGMHGFFEQSDRGERVRAPGSYRNRIELRAAAMSQAGLVVDPDLIERKVIIPKLKCAGRFDRGVWTSDGRLLIFDDKSQDDIYSTADPAIQFAMYANAEYMWDEEKLCYVDAPAFDKDVAVLAWSPKHGNLCTENERGACIEHVDQCELFAVDIAEGWRVCLEVIPQVKEHRNRGKRKGGYGLSLSWPFLGVESMPTPMNVERMAQMMAGASSLDDLDKLRREADRRRLWCEEVALAYMAAATQLVSESLLS